MNDLKERVIELEKYLVKTRRFLHENPEVSGKEYNTATFLKAEINKLGLPIEQASNTGFIATLDTGKPGKIVALRTDIDALPVDESPENLKGKRLVTSQIEGVAHMCGHDGHMAIILASMKLLCEYKEKLSGKIIFVFEEGEEIGCGIADMIKLLKSKNIDAIYGTHLTSFMDTGTICLDEGPRMAGAAVIEMNILGKSGHGSRPDLSINPVFAAAQVLNGISNAWNNQIDVSKTVTLGLTQIHGGQINNVIPDKVFIGGTLRFFDLDEGHRAVNVLKEVASLTAQVHKCSVEFNETTKVATIPLINDKHLSSIARNAVTKNMPEALVTDVKWYASESFARYHEVAPIVFSFVGTRNNELGSGAEHHNEKFDIDEKSLTYATLATTQFAIDFLNS